MNENKLEPYVTTNVPYTLWRAKIHGGINDDHHTVMLLILADLATGSSSNSNGSEKPTEKGLTCKNRADLQYKTSAKGSDLNPLSHI